MSSEISISVVVRTFNSARTLGHVLDGMRFTERDQLIVVDSGSSDSTLAIARKYRAVVVEAPPPFNYSKSLNLGIQAAINPWILVISSHCIPVVPDFLGVFRRECALLPDDVVVGYAPSSISGRSDAELESERTVLYSAAQYPAVRRICGNGNTIYRRRALEEVRFNETIRTAEDKVWILEMLKRNYRFAYIPSARGINKNQASLVYMFRKGYRDARALRDSHHRPMKLRHLLGAVKNMLLQRIRKDIDSGNCLRYSAHAFGQFLGSRKNEDNTPLDGGS